MVWRDLRHAFPSPCMLCLCCWDDFTSLSFHFKRIGWFVLLNLLLCRYLRNARGQDYSGCNPFEMISVDKREWLCSNDSFVLLTPTL